jgi:hypothetical protein
VFRTVPFALVVSALVLELVVMMVVVVVVVVAVVLELSSPSLAPLWGRPQEVELLMALVAVGYLSRVVVVWN